MIGPNRARLSNDALDDLYAIFRHVADDDPEAARRVVASIQDKIRSIALSGNPGVARDWLSPGLRAFPYRSYCIYFRISDSRLTVLRIKHGRQNIAPDDFPESEA